MQPLYDSGDLLGFAICAQSGGVLHNESIFSDEAVQQVIQPFIDCASGLSTSGRDVQRLTVDAAQMVLIYGMVGEHYGLFVLDPESDLDHAAEVLS